MNQKLRNRLEEQKTILSKRVKRDGWQEQLSYQRSRLPSKLKRRIRRTLLSALANRQVEEVNQAIQRFDEGVYGICDECGDEIDRNRLEAMPTTTRCWNCQYGKRS